MGRTQTFCSQHHYALWTGTAYGCCLVNQDARTARWIESGLDGRAQMGVLSNTNLCSERHRFQSAAFDAIILYAYFFFPFPINSFTVFILLTVVAVSSI